MRLLFILSVFPCVIFAQQQSASIPKMESAIRLFEQQPASASFAPEKIAVSDAAMSESVQQYLQKTVPVLQDPQTGLVLAHRKHTRMGWHLSYQQTYLGIPVLGATIKVNTNDEGVVLSSFSKLLNTENWKAGTFTPNALMGKAVWVIVDNTPQPAYQKWEGGNYIVTTAQGETVRLKDAHMYFAKEDTLVAGKVFLPDPLTPIGVISGENGTYKHYNDSDYALLNDQRVMRNFPATFDNGLFTLKNTYVELVDFMSPTIAPPTSANPQFDFLRGEDGFKDVMVCFHISNLQQYLKSIGIDEMNFPVKADAHAGTADNSSFLSSDTTLKFGTGGVPDAEDADVIVHEYTHGLSFFTCPSDIMSNERRAIEESLCDIQAALYSQRYAIFNWRKLYNWDAPNPTAVGTTPFWNGRNGESSKTYANYINSPYSDSEIWTSTLLDISEAIGGDSTLVLMFASLASYTDNTTMPEAATLFMQADSVLMNKAFGWKIGPIFNARGLGNFPVGISEQQAILNAITIKNTAGFAAGTANAEIEMPFNTTVNIYDVQGKLVLQQNASIGTFSLDPALFQHGMYLVKIGSDSAQTTFKLLKY